MSTTALAGVSEPVEAVRDPQSLWRLYHGDAGSRDENALVEKYLPLVRSVLGRLLLTLPDQVDHDDLRSAGLVGLLQALRNFDPRCGTAFEAYARLRIRGAMLDEVRRMDWVPRTVHEKSRRIQAAMVRLEQRLGRAPNDEEVARELNLTPSAYQSLLEEVRPATFVCLDAVHSSESADAGGGNEEVLNSAEENPLEHTSRNELKELILRRLRDLPENHRKVMALYYGEDLLLREIAELMGLTESRVCQIHSQAILSIRAYLQKLETDNSATALTGRHP